MKYKTLYIYYQGIYYINVNGILVLIIKLNIKMLKSK